MGEKNRKTPGRSHLAYVRESANGDNINLYVPRLFTLISCEYIAVHHWICPSVKRRNRNGDIAPTSRSVSYVIKFSFYQSFHTALLHVT